MSDGPDKEPRVLQWLGGAAAGLEGVWLQYDPLSACPRAGRVQLVVLYQESVEAESTFFSSGKCGYHL